MFYTIPHIGYMKLDKKGFLNNDERTSVDIQKYGYPEEALINWCNDVLIKDDKIFIDIGAHNGTWSTTIASKAKHTYSFECNPEIYCCFCGNIFLKQLCHKITPLNIGLSNIDDSLTYYYRTQDGGGNGFTYLGLERDEDSIKKSLPVRTLDSYNLTNIGFIKIDVEGHEKQVLEGAVETLKNNNYPPFVFESWSSWREDNEKHIPARKLRDDLFSFIKTLGYIIRPLNGYDEIFIASK